LPSAPAALPISVPRGAGVLLVPPTAAERAHPATFHEVFSGTDYWIRQTVRHRLARAGTYDLVIFETGGPGGKYCLAVGQGEQFSPGDLLQIPALLQRLHAWFS
jgi:hypothetical protein